MQFVFALSWRTEIEKEDQLLDQLLVYRSVAMERIIASQQHFILVASLIDRIPNLAGLARTCEVCWSLIRTNLCMVYLLSVLVILLRSILFFWQSLFWAGF